MSPDAMAAQWYKSAVFYEVLVRSFADSDGNGIGDLAGLTGKLDYLDWLGVDCLWLPPFFPSPLRDGGYDVADYANVQAELGTMDDLVELLSQAHARGMKVITDFVMNHTSDQHPWFQASRTDPKGPYGDFYIWRDAPDEFLDARVIFTDSLDSNWSYDEVRGQYFWHRFYPFQPDLNFENPRVLDEILDAIRFWLDRGVDGFRLDAVPYLVEADGTNCENLPGTHEILKKVRAMVDAEFPGRILLCEANQWPEDVIEYFGDDDECQLAFHFPVMPRLYLALKQGSRASLSQIMAATPDIPPNAQWSTFLRNHDELTLEMVTEEDRQFMWREYAPVERMTCNLGIRRRLAPLLDNDRRRIELLHALLFSLPGSPCLYYGDEIGMGDNIWLPDRDGVRTPMQWNATADAGFSEADAAAFPYPLVDDPEYAPSVVNVAAQENDPYSLLNWVREMLAVRATVPALALGDFVDLEGSDGVFSFTRSHEEATIISLNNLTATEQTIRLDGDRLDAAGFEVVAGDLEATASEDDPLLSLTLPPYGFAWLRVIR